MVVDVNNLIAAINPKIFCSTDLKDYKPLYEIVKEAAKKEGYLKAAEKVKLRESEYIELEDAFMKNPFSKYGQKNPIERHVLSYDTTTENLETIYFWLIDYINKEYDYAEKLTDNFVIAPGSNFFSEMMGKATKMQEEAMRIMGVANQLVKSILNLVYDLKEFKMVLSPYDDLKSKDKSVRRGARLSLKQRWLDTVDIKRGNTSLKGIAFGGAGAPGGGAHLLDAFMIADSLDDIEKMDINETMRRLLQQKIPEFSRWIKESEKELRKRFELERIYLKSQVNSVKMYARWVKPYLKAAKELEQRSTTPSAILSASSTALFELTILGRGKDETPAYVGRGELPRFIKDAKRREYNKIGIVDLKFRSAPERNAQGQVLRGRLDITFTSFALNKDEQEVLRKELEKDDFGDMLRFMEGATTESLEQIQADLDEFLPEEKEVSEEKEEKKESSDVNPFSALFSIFKKEKKKVEKKEEKAESIAPDSYIEEAIRSLNLIESRKECRKLYDTFKKAHGMVG